MTEENEAGTVEETEQQGESATQDEVQETEQEEGKIDQAPEQEKESKSGIQKRFGTLTRKRYEAEERAAQAEAELEELRRKVVVPTGEPTLEAFDYDEDAYLQAKIKHEVQQNLAIAHAEAEKAKAEQSRKELDAEFARRIEESGIEGYHEAVQNLAESKIPLNADVVSAIQQDKNGPQLAFHLGTNLEVADRLSRMTPVQAALELGRISANLEAQPKKKITNAPDPIKPADSGGGGLSKAPDEMSMDEIMSL